VPCGRAVHRANQDPLSCYTCQVGPSISYWFAQCIPPNERARAVSLTTSGMYLGSAAAMLVLPSLAAAMGPAYLLRANGCLGLAWLLLWSWANQMLPNAR
jgi:MFS transporter, ACS family, solute carrier family 17 (sodium-dependent inorganic phosphate cotransporter), other